MSSNNPIKLRICTFWQQNRCRHGSACNFAHGVKELRNYDGSLVYPPSVTVNDVPKKVTPKKKPQKKVKPVVKKASFAVLFEDSGSETETEAESSDSDSEEEVIPIKNSGEHSWYDMMQEEFGDNWPPPSNSVYVC